MPSTTGKRGRPRFLDEEAVLTRIALGDSTKAIADDLGCHPTSVVAIARRNGVTPDKRVLVHSFDAAIQSALDRGVRGIRNISKEAGCSERTVSYALARLRGKKK